MLQRPVLAGCIRIMTEAKPGSKGPVKRVGSDGGVVVVYLALDSFSSGEMTMGQVRAGDQGAPDSSKGAEPTSDMLVAIK